MIASRSPVCAVVNYCCEYRWWVDKIFWRFARDGKRYSTVAVFPSAGRRGTGRVRCSFVCRLFRHLSTTATAMAEVAVGGVYCVYAHTAVSRARVVFGVRSSPPSRYHPAARIVGFPEAVSRPPANGLGARANQPFPLARPPGPITMMM